MVFESFSDNKTNITPTQEDATPKANSSIRDSPNRNTYPYKLCSMGDCWDNPTISSVAFIRHTANHSTLVGSVTLAYTFGLRHALDADHIAAIDNVVPS
jgi:hypothetical protein